MKFHQIYIFFPEMAETLSEWNKGELDSFLIEISANILKYKDTDGLPLVEKIRDAAGQKGIYWKHFSLQVNLFQKHLFLHQLTYNMT